jgi:fructokinase
MSTTTSGTKAGNKIVVGLGELLWDLLPEGPRLGGAPANFAVMAGRLGDHSVIASRIGADSLADDARALLASMPVDCGFLQTDAERPTSTVTVKIENGEPHYTIHHPVAWDALAFTPEWHNLAQQADAVCFGTLAQRDAASRQTILAFLDATKPACARIFDVNLRAPFWSGEVLRESMGRATIVKLNAAEMPQVLAATNACPHPPAEQDEDELLRGAHLLLDRYPMHLLCVTMGGEGSLLVTRDCSHRHHGLATTVRDTVGAGDAFTAALAHYYLEGAALPTLSEAGNRWGAWMASQSGAMPPLDPSTAARMSMEIRARRASG